MGIQNNAAAGRDFRDDILREQVRLVFQHLPTMQAASLAVALVLCHVVRDMAPLRNILTWILMVLAVVLARIILYHRFGKVGAGRFSGERWRNAYIALAFASGIIWGLAAFIVFPGGRLELMALFVLVITSLAAATTVTNTGCGLDTTATEKIFDPFFSTKFTGRGLGLPVVLGIARAHDGGISVENNPGGGARFQVYLPFEGNVPYLGNN